MLAQQSAMEQMMSAMGTGAMGDAMGAMVGAGIGIGVCIGIGWALLKIAYFVASILHFKKPHIQAWFEPQGAMGPAPTPTY